MPSRPSPDSRSPLHRVQRWVEHRRARSIGGWEALKGLPAEGAAREALRLVGLKVLPDAHLPPPVPDWMATVLFQPVQPALAANSSVWTLVSAQEQSAFKRQAAHAELQAKHLAPWAWAWAHHPQGITPWLETLMKAWRHGNSPLAQALLDALPGSRWQEHLPPRWPWQTLWRRPVQGLAHPNELAGASTLVDGERGDWRHTLCLWEMVAAVLPDPSVVEQQLLTWPALAPGQGDYFGTNPDASRWRAPQLRAWLQLGIPFPSFEGVLWWMGLDWKAANPWGDWLSEGFDPVVDRTHAETKAQAALEALGEFGVPVPPALRQRLLLAWLADPRQALGQFQALDDPERLACEDRWAQWLTQPWPPAPDEHGWVHAVARSKGVPALRCRSLKKIWWNGLPPAVFAHPRDGQLPWEVFRDQWGTQFWQDPHHVAVQDWLRHQATEYALDQALPPAATHVTRQRF